MRALENEMLRRIQKQGLDVSPKILIVSDSKSPLLNLHSVSFIDLMNEALSSYFIETLLVLLGYKIDSRCKRDNVQSETGKS